MRASILEIPPALGELGTNDLAKMEEYSDKTQKHTTHPEMAMKPGLVMCICNPTTRETEAKELALVGYHELHTCSEILSLSKRGKA